MRRRRRRRPAGVEQQRDPRADLGKLKQTGGGALGDLHFRVAGGGIPPQRKHALRGVLHLAQRAWTRRL